MSTRKNFTKDELKGFITILKDITGVEYDSRNLTNKEQCLFAMKQIIKIKVYDAVSKETTYLSNRIKRYNTLNVDLINKNIELEDKIKKLKNKKWWKFWE